MREIIKSNFKIEHPEEIFDAIQNFEKLLKIAEVPDLVLILDFNGLVPKLAFYAKEVFNESNDKRIPGTNVDNFEVFFKNIPKKIIVNMEEILAKIKILGTDKYETIHPIMTKSKMWEIY